MRIEQGQIAPVSRSAVGRRGRKSLPRKKHMNTKSSMRRSRCSGVCAVAAAWSSQRPNSMATYLAA